MIEWIRTSRLSIKNSLAKFQPPNPKPQQGQLLTLTVEDYSAVLRDEPIGQVFPYTERRRWSSNSSGKCSYELLTRGTVCGTMRSMRGADAACSAQRYQSLHIPNVAHTRHSRPGSDRDFQVKVFETCSLRSEVESIVEDCAAVLRNEPIGQARSQH
jgi:hypothetical protein